MLMSVNWMQFVCINMCACVCMCPRVCLCVHMSVYMNLTFQSGAQLPFRPLSRKDPLVALVLLAELMSGCSPTIILKSSLLSVFTL